MSYKNIANNPFDSFDSFEKLLLTTSLTLLRIRESKYVEKRLKTNKNGRQGENQTSEIENKSKNITLYTAIIMKWASYLKTKTGEKKYYTNAAIVY